MDVSYTANLIEKLYQTLLSFKRLDLRKKGKRLFCRAFNFIQNLYFSEYKRKKIVFSAPPLCICVFCSHETKIALFDKERGEIMECEY